MNINGKFSRVSKDYGKHGPVLVGLVGDVYPHDLSAANLAYIKTFYMRDGWGAKLLAEWPKGIEPAYPAAMKNFKNGFILISKTEE
jgi:hypothetical protein